MQPRLCRSEGTSERSRSERGQGEVVDRIRVGNGGGDNSRVKRESQEGYKNNWVSDLLCIHRYIISPTVTVDA